MEGGGTTAHGRSKECGTRCWESTGSVAEGQALDDEGTSKSRLEDEVSEGEFATDVKVNGAAVGRVEGSGWSGGCRQVERGTPLDFNGGGKGTLATCR